MSEGQPNFFWGGEIGIANVAAVSLIMFLCNNSLRAGRVSSFKY